MTIDERIDLIRQARSLVGAALVGDGLPQIEAILRSADQELHWALWNLGEPVAMRAELAEPTLNAR